MRVFAILAAATLLGAAVQAEEVLSGRKLHNGGAENSRSTEYFTEKFCSVPECYGKAADFDGAYGIGVIIGAIATFLAMVFAIVVIVVDEMQRHKEFAAKIVTAKIKLTGEHGVSQELYDSYIGEFEEKEARGADADHLKEQEELAEIN